VAGTHSRFRPRAFGTGEPPACGCSLSIHAAACTRLQHCADGSSSSYTLVIWFWRICFLVWLFSGFGYMPWTRTELGQPSARRPLSCQHGSPTRPAPLHRAWAGPWTGVGNRTAVRARPSQLSAVRHCIVASLAAAHGGGIHAAAPILTTLGRRQYILPVQLARCSRRSAL